MIKLPNNYAALFIFLSLSNVTLQAQEILTKDEAVKITLENNYGVQVAKNDVKVADNNDGLLNSGYLPTVSAATNATYVRDHNNTATFRDGTNTVLINAESRRYNANGTISYTLFDGLGRMYNYKRLKESHQLSELQARQTIEQTIFQLMTGYFDVARLKQTAETAQQSLQISRNRLTRAKYVYEYGQNTQLDVLNAEVDVNNDSIAYLNTNQLYMNAKRDLNFVMGREVRTDFDVDTTVVFIPPLNLELLIEEAKKNNVSLLQAESNINIRKYDLKVNRSSFLPTLGVSGSYNWAEFQNNSSAFLQTQETNGFSGTATLSWSIFNGADINRVKNAKIAIESEEIRKKQAEQQVVRDVSNAFETYENQLYVLQTQEKNLLTNKRNFQRSEEQFKLGQITSIDFRTAQINLINAKINRDTAKFDAKLAEINLLQLSGKLLDVAF
ncbi:MAG: transporter [Bacteroidetes bacterium HGW-Bacteroidetes-13]|nr:MAG: transporter [Bacteroidetes bacterium HGW-Bacteroidetes-13]